MCRLSLFFHIWLKFIFFVTINYKINKETYCFIPQHLSLPLSFFSFLSSLSLSPLSLSVSLCLCLSFSLFLSVYVSFSLSLFLSVSVSFSPTSSLSSYLKPLNLFVVFKQLLLSICWFWQFEISVYFIRVCWRRDTREYYLWSCKYLFITIIYIYNLYYL